MISKKIKNCMQTIVSDESLKAGICLVVDDDGAPVMGIHGTPLDVISIMSFAAVQIGKDLGSIEKVASIIRDTLIEASKLDFDEVVIAEDIIEEAYNE